MAALGSFEEALWIANIALTAALLVRLSILRMAGTYAALSVFLALQTLRSLWLLQFQPNANEYVFPYVFTEPVLVVSRVLVVFELYDKILEGYRGLAILSRGTMAGVLGVSLVASIAAHVPEFTVRNEPFQVLRALHLFETTVYTALLFFLLLLAGFMLWYPARIKKNVLLHAWAFSAYFVSSSVAVFLRNMDAAAWTRIASTGRIAVTGVSLLVWCILVRKSWETEAGASSIRHDAADERRLLAQLEALSRKLETRN